MSPFELTTVIVVCIGCGIAIGMKLVLWATRDRELDRIQREASKGIRRVRAGSHPPIN